MSRYNQLMTRFGSTDDVGMEGPLQQARVQEGKLLKVDSSIHFLTEPNSNRIYGSGYLNIQTTDLDNSSGNSRVKESDVIIYKVRTTGPDKFCVNQPVGLLRSRQYACIHVKPTTTAAETSDNIARYKFQVLALVIPPNHPFLMSQAAGDSGEGIEIEKLNKTALYCLWNELAQIPGAYVERHKTLVQVHPVENSTPTRKKKMILQTSALQMFGIIIAAILLIWVAMRLAFLNDGTPSQSESLENRENAKVGENQPS